MEFNNLGKRCSNKYCNQLDYLPFQCKYCSKWHCSTHASDHGCGAYQNDDRHVMKCPVCNKVLKYSSNDDPNVLWTIHYNEECNQGNTPNINTENKKTIVRCAFQRCPTKLNNVNKYSCSKCKKDFCNTHRLQEYHECSNISQWPRQKRFRKRM